MQGTILNYSIQDNMGAISGEDGIRYKFNGSQWHGAQAPAAGQKVDFVAADGSAAEIYLMQSQANTFAGLDLGTKNRVTAAVLAILLGSFGAHKFYLGHNAAGITMLAVWASGFLLSSLFIGALWIWIPGLIGLIEGIIYLTKSDEDFEQIYITGNKTWF